MTDKKIPTIRESKARLRKAGFGEFAETSVRYPEAERGLWPSRWLVGLTAYGTSRSKFLRREAWGERERAARRLAYWRAAEAAERRGR